MQDKNVTKNYRINSIGLVLLGMLSLILLANIPGLCRQKPKPRIIISSDIGGTDDDDFQSMIHLLMYADRFHIEGLISSPYGKGRKKDILKIINLYQKDLPKLRQHSEDFPSADSLRRLCKQGALEGAPYEGYAHATEGSDWIIHCAERKSDQPLWILVWGGIEDLAQALHDAPDIEKKIRVYWIGGPNKKFSVNAYAYIAQNFPDLWIIENNASYRGWFMDAHSPKKWRDAVYYDRYIRGYGALGKDFKNYYNGKIKMGDTPSLAYLLNGNPDEPTGQSWGGSFTPIKRSARTVFDGNSTLRDTVAVYSILEWRFRGPVSGIPQDSACFILETGGQQWPGFYLGKGIYSVRYSPKRAETGNYKLISRIPQLNGQTGGYVSINPWPGMPGKEDYSLGGNWYSDRSDPDLFLADQQGAKTVSKHRRAFLSDWAKRWSWLK